MNEIKETAIWLINILGMLAIVVGGILMKSATWLVIGGIMSVSYTHLRAHETGRNLVCRLLLEKKKNTT